MLLNYKKLGLQILTEEATRVIDIWKIILKNWFGGQ